MELNFRSRRETVPGSGPVVLHQHIAAWEAAQTAAIICDMWDQHWCAGASARVAEMAPRMNALIAELRRRGVLIIHAPSDTLDFYAGHPSRKLAQATPPFDRLRGRNKGGERRPESTEGLVEPAPFDTLRARSTGGERRPESTEGLVEPPIPLQRWVHLIPEREDSLPIDDSDGGCDCRPPCVQGRPWRRQIATIEIADGDAISDSAETYSLMRGRGIENVLIMGVHVNMCVLGRPFGIRQLVLQGMNVALVRDLTDAMYNSRMPPFVDHFAGVELMIEHIERHWCPTITSDQLLGGQAFHFRR